MVERPIKKSERQTVAPSSDVSEQVKGKERPTEESVDSTSRRSFQKKDKSKGKGKRDQKDSAPSRVNPALVRGPKPTQPKPPVLEETPEETIEPGLEQTPEETIEDSVTSDSEESTATP
ncbi:MAG: hypothetical protein ICV63_16945 [Coleofasciculus sp. Co-bin14]|nr:hypothetical protein [Coleofasciculus sp. Co-bin14]